jgi:hypothetical protein
LRKRTVIVKVFLTLNLDEDEYPIPVDGFVDEEIKDALQEFIYDVDGMEIKSIKLITE